ANPTQSLERGMLRLPSRIHAQLADVSGHSLAAADVLIALNILVEGRYYYGNLLGLTNRSGVASIARDELDLRFASDRANYPMDYKVALEECDPQIELAVLSEREIDQAKDAVAASPTISPDIR